MDRISMPVKVFIAVFCILATVVLFFESDLFSNNTKTLSAMQADEDYRDAFQFEPEELTYDGTGEIDFLQGVTLDSYSVGELEDMVFIRIFTGENLSQKIVEYTADTENGRVRSRRLLNLRNYKGPKIELPNDMPSVTENTLADIADILSLENDYKANDGFGHDARKHVQIETEKSNQNSSLVYCTFILENEFADRAVAKADLILTEVPATIILTDSIVYLNVGDYFDPALYIKSAIDAEGQSITEEVNYEGEIDTNQPGEYEVHYKLRGQSVAMTVIVTENLKQ